MDVLKKIDLQKPKSISKNQKILIKKISPISQPLIYQPNHENNQQDN